MSRLNSIALSRSSSFNECSSIRAFERAVALFGGHSADCRDWTTRISSFELLEDEYGEIVHWWRSGSPTRLTSLLGSLGSLDAVPPGSRKSM